jgi:hypothetical protein
MESKKEIRLTRQMKEKKGCNIFVVELKLVGVSDPTIIYHL